jgi:hypothetical protein
LTTEEIIRFGGAGVARCANALEKRRSGAHGFNRDNERWQIDVEGLLAEAAAAKALGLPYEPTVGELDTHLGDIGPRLQVRSTKYPTGSLLIHDKDADRDKFILVTGIYGVYDIRGWIYGEEGKFDKYKKQHGGRWAYWIGQHLLRPMESCLAAA